MYGDVHDADSLRPAFAGCRRGLLPGALPRGLQGLRAARRRGRPRFATAAADAGVSGSSTSVGSASESDELSAHLRSRREVEGLLGGAGVPVTVLRAGIIVGHGGISWEMTRQLVDHLPAMITPGGCTPGPSRSPSPTWCATSSGCSTCPRRPGGCWTSAGRRSWSTWTMLRRVVAIEGRRLSIVPGAAAHPAALVALAVAGHQRRRADRPVADRLDGQRGGRARRQHPRWSRSSRWSTTRRSAPPWPSTPRGGTLDDLGARGWPNRSM